jgi:uncharacterized repeat protein (TIGR03803 family)
MNRPSARTVITTALLRYGLSFSAATALLTGCGGSQPPLSEMPQGEATEQSLALDQYSSLHTFGRSKADGLNPSADLIDVNGTLYGTTVGGGSYRYGTVFSIATSGKETVLHSFGSPYDGLNPEARLLNVNGTLYGTTAAGGANGGGTVFSMSLDGTEKILHSFDYPYSNPQKGGDGPEGGLINVNGTLYGTTAQGGAFVCGGDAYLCGTVFSITTSGKKFKVLHSFGETNYDGESPAAALVNVDGTLYGTTTAGGKGDGGTVFSITPDGREHVVYSFGANSYDGTDPFSALINVKGALVGTTSASGAGQGGTVFSMTTDGRVTTIVSFNGSNGSAPLADLKNVKGVLYGTTSAGGLNNLGTVFRVTKSGKETVLHSFGNGTGTQPRAGLAAVAGRLYGTTYGTTATHPKTYGNVFSITP